MCIPHHEDMLSKEIGRLRKLRHLIGNELSLIQLKDSIGEMTSLQTLHKVEGLHFEAG